MAELEKGGELESQWRETTRIVVKKGIQRFEELSWVEDKRLDIHHTVSPVSAAGNGFSALKFSRSNGCGQRLSSPISF